MTIFTGQRCAGLQAALVDAFTVGEMRQLVSITLDVDFDVITSVHKPLLERTFDLIGYAKSRGLLVRLILGARAANSGNKRLRDFVESLPPGWESTSETDPIRRPIASTMLALGLLVLGLLGVTLAVIALWPHEQVTRPDGGLPPDASPVVDAARPIPVTDARVPDPPVPTRRFWRTFGTPMQGALRLVSSLSECRGDDNAPWLGISPDALRGLVRLELPSEAEESFGVVREPDGVTRYGETFCPHVPGQPRWFIRVAVPARSDLIDANQTVDRVMWRPAPDSPLFALLCLAGTEYARVVAGQRVRCGGRRYSIANVRNEWSLVSQPRSEPQCCACGSTARTRRSCYCPRGDEQWGACQ